MTHQFWNIFLLAVKNYSGNSNLDNEIQNCVYELGSGGRSLDLRCSHLVRPGSHRRYGPSMDLLSYSGTVQARVSTDRLSGIAFQNLIWPVNMTGSSSLFEVTVTYFNDEWQSIKTSALWMTAIALLIDKMVPPCIKYVHVRQIGRPEVNGPRYHLDVSDYFNQVIFLFYYLYFIKHVEKWNR